MTLARILPHLNACMNATSAICLIAGVVTIRAKQLERHKRWMIGAVCASTVFLVGYITRHILTGTAHFEGTPGMRTAYHCILYSHMVLAVVTVPLVLRLLNLVKQERIEEHKRLARLTVPIWFYVSVTGVVVYTFLYHLQ